MNDLLKFKRTKSIASYIVVLNIIVHLTPLYMYYQILGFQKMKLGIWKIQP